LISAARQGHIGAVRLILTADGIDIRHRDGIFGETALMAARSNGHLEVVQLLQTYTEE
jgi:ankyrin repeat protein